MPRLGRQGKPAENKLKEEAAGETSCIRATRPAKHGRNFTPNRLTGRTAKAVSDWQEIRTTRKQSVKRKANAHDSASSATDAIHDPERPSANLLSEAKAALHISNGALTRHLEKLRKGKQAPRRTQNRAA